MIGRPGFTHECIGGGPCDGGYVTLQAGKNVFRLRIGNVWHSYRLQPTDEGTTLVYIGMITRDVHLRLRHEPAELE